MDLMDELENEMREKSIDITNQSEGLSIFNKNQVMEVGNVLDRLLRLIFINNNIGLDYLSEKNRLYALDKRGVLPSKVSNSRGNLLTAISTGNLTWKKFQEIIVGILEYNINVEVTLTNKKGEKQIYNYQEEIASLLKELQEQEKL